MNQPARSPRPPTPRATRWGAVVLLRSARGGCRRSTKLRGQCGRPRTIAWRRGRFRTSRLYRRGRSQSTERGASHANPSPGHERAGRKTSGLSEKTLHWRWGLGSGVGDAGRCVLHSPTSANASVVPGCCSPRCTIDHAWAAEPKPAAQPRGSIANATRPRSTKDKKTPGNKRRRAHEKTQSQAALILDRRIQRRRLIRNALVASHQEYLDAAIRLATAG